MNKKPRPFWKICVPESHTHKLLLIVVVLAVLYLLTRVVF